MCMTFLGEVKEDLRQGSFYKPSIFIDLSKVQEFANRAQFYKIYTAQS